MEDAIPHLERSMKFFPSDRVDPCEYGLRQHLRNEPVTGFHAKAGSPSPSAAFLPEKLISRFLDPIPHFDRNVPQNRRQDFQQRAEATHDIAASVSAIVADEVVLA
jgi:hypothetical protein